jgi:hypothetical protein
MTLRILAAGLIAALLVSGCAGPAKLAERSENKLAQGDVWKAWHLATKALDKAPAHPDGKQAAAAAARVIADDWQRRIHALATVDSFAAAEQVLEFVQFRTGAIRYTTVPVTEQWTREENQLRRRVARAHYEDGNKDLNARRPKAAFAHFRETERFWPGYEDAAQLAEIALREGETRVAIVPLHASSGPKSLGGEIANSWRGDLIEHLSPGNYFTRILPSEAIEKQLRVSDLGRIGREDAIRYAKKAGADRVVWGTIGEVDSKSSIQYFRDTVYRRAREKDGNGAWVTRWIGVPLEVIARVRTVDVDLAYEVITTDGGVTIAHERDTQSMRARVVWTAYTPESGPDTYSLVTDEMRAGDPERAKQIETKWSAVVGEGTTLAQVLDAKRAKSKQTTGEAVARFMAGAAFVMLEDLPSTEELAFGALANGWKPVHATLVRLDGIDDVDLGAASASTSR